MTRGLRRQAPSPCCEDDRERDDRQPRCARTECPVAKKNLFEPEIGHHRTHHSTRKANRWPDAPLASTKQDLITIDQPSLVINQQDPIAITVERYPQVGSFLDHPGSQAFGVGRPAIPVDVEPVRLMVNRNDFSTQFRKYFGCNPVSGAIGAIDHDLEAIQPGTVGHRGLAVLDIAADRILDPGGFAQTVRRYLRQGLIQFLFDGCLQLIIQFLAQSGKRT